MKYILMMNGTKASFAEYAKWSKKDMEANVAFMRAFSKRLKDEGVYVATEGLGWPDQAKLVRSGKQIDYEGAFSPVDFDAKGDIGSAVFEIWKYASAGKIDTLKTITFRG